MSGTRGSGGKNKKALAVHIGQGTFRPHRHGNAAPTPEPPIGRPDPPSWMTAEERHEHATLCDLLAGAKTLTLADGPAIETIVPLLLRRQRYAADDRRFGRSIRRLTKQSKQLQGAELATVIREIASLEKLRNKSAVQMRQNANVLRAWLVECGLTPSSRSRVSTVPTPPAEDERKARFFGRASRAPK